MKKTKGNVAFEEIVSQASLIANALGVHPDIDDPHMVRGAICRLCFQDEHAECHTIGHLFTEDGKTKALAQTLMAKAREKAEFLFCHQPEFSASSLVDAVREGAILAHDCVIAVEGMPNQIVPLANEAVSIMTANSVGLLCDHSTAELTALTENETVGAIQDIVASVPSRR